jgi:pantetheine-phosphate adenylyltransferase
MLESRRKSRGDGNSAVRRLDGHGSDNQSRLSTDFGNRWQDEPSYQSAFHFRIPLRFSLMRRAIYPGSFDPVTNGHLDVVERARKLFDEVIVAVACNDEKQPLFSLRERLNLLQRTLGNIENVRIAQFKGLLVKFAKAEKAGAVIRGLRAVSDFEFEFQMALMNRKLDAVVETIFLMPKEEYTYLSSRIVKEIAHLGGDVSSFVPTCVAKALNRKFNR